MNYLYNGVELPALPERDKEKYPYAHIDFDHFSDNHFYRLTFTSKPIELKYTKKWYEDNFGTPPDNTNYVTTDGSYAYISYITKKDGVVSVDGEWAFRQSYEGDNVHILLNNPVIWSNYDMCYSDGEVLVAASDPIPVGGELDHASFLQGWLVGRRLAGMRK